MGELLSAIKNLKGKEASAPDNILSSFLKSLGPLALHELLSIFNSPFSRAQCLRIWVASIIPLLKAGKSPSKVASFCCISFTSCAVKLLACIRADRLYYIAKTNNLLSHFQARFQKDWSCEESDYSNNSSNKIWFLVMTDATLRTDTVRL